MVNITISNRSTPDEKHQTTERQNENRPINRQNDNIFFRPIDHDQPTKLADNMMHICGDNNLLHLVIKVPY